GAPARRPVAGAPGGGPRGPGRGGGAGRRGPRRAGGAGRRGRPVSRLTARWSALPVDERGRLHGLVVCAALYLVHYATLSTWFIEDAAITFAFARHVAEGEGFVAWPGGERVEGFS